jgi:hypothetical protein
MLGAVAAPVRGSSGFTLLEVPVAIAATVGIIASIFVIYLASLHSWSGTAALAGIQREASLAMEMMTHDVRPGSAFTIGSGGDSLEVTYWTGGADSVIARFYKDVDGNLRDISGGIMTTRVDSLAFSAAGAKTINIDLTVRNDLGTTDTTADDQVVVVSSTVVCRN